MPSLPPPPPPPPAPLPPGLPTLPAGFLKHPPPPPLPPGPAGAPVATTTASASDPRPACPAVAAADVQCPGESNRPSIGVEDERAPSTPASTSAAATNIPCTSCTVSAGLARKIQRCCD